MKPTKLLAMLGMGMIAACGGGGGGGQVAGIDGGGTPTPVATVVSKGTITGFGSVIVNGVHYDSNGADITIDDNPGLESDLAVGDIVVVKGTLNSSGTSGSADSIDFDDAVEGPISAIDLAGGTITVLGQTVVIDDLTSFDDRISPPTIGGLAQDDVVEVAGFFLTDGSISATRIEPKPAGGEFEVTGIVGSLTATSFQLNSLVVDFSSAMLDNFPGGAPAEGQPVEVKGTELGGAGQLIASRVEFKGNELAGSAGDRYEVEGYISNFDSPAQFEVDGVPVTTNGSTTYENGAVGELADDRKIEVEGDLNAAGVLVAEKIEFKLGTFIRIEAPVEDVKAATLTLLGVVVNVNVATRFEDKSDARVTQFDLADVNIGDYVAIRGYEDSSGVVATLLERDDARNDVSLRGFIESVSDPQFAILGVTIVTDALPAPTVFRDASGNVITPADFFGLDFSVPRLVEAKGQLSNGQILAEEVQREN